MNKTLLILSFLLILLIQGCQSAPEVLRIAVTTDVHGTIFPYDFINHRESPTSLAQVARYAEAQRTAGDTAFVLFDNGDFLQGQPTVYYSNFVDTAGPHLSARVMNFMGYEAATVGNHDIEAGPVVYRKVEREMNFPWLAANAVDTRSGEPAFPPYAILRKGKLKIAVLGLITPGIPQWLPENLWPYMEFRDMTETARIWVERIRVQEKPDLLIGLFHSGTDLGYGGDPDPYLNENATRHVAREVPGFDIVFAGHDHQTTEEWILNAAGDSVLLLDPGSHARFVGEATVTFRKGARPLIVPRMVDMSVLQPSPSFEREFAADRAKVEDYLDDTITWLAEEMRSLDALFGPSSMMSLIHQLQKEISGADLSFTAPLSLNSTLRKGPLLVSDMFALYRFENLLYTMDLSGREIDGFLEYAAGLWFQGTGGQEPHLLRFDPDHPGRLAEPYYNFSTASGIDYEIDLRKPVGDRVAIQRFSNGNPFDPDSTYRVAVNSYRGNGGGGHLTQGSGIPQGELAGRVVGSTDIDLRYLLMQMLSQHDTLRPRAESNWKILPEDWARSASASDRLLLE